MEIKITICDKEGCKKRRTSPNRVWSYTESDPSGNGSNACYMLFDLCPAHQKEYKQAAGELEGPTAAQALRDLHVKYRMW